ncbi:3D domain-containing protein [Bacillus cereus]|uniref:3D domain-containing protein n=1 Tax=Bacillus cereus TaxID=1396 RepID=UPI002570E954|nr:3D domain-containing protein [Bacillus cereus]WJE27128.1 3D domain-containing protein [Bacillus cereus]
MLKHSVMMGAFANADTKENVEKSFYAYNEASFTSGKSNGGVEYTPQTILVKEKRNNGWWKIQTWEGEKWINLNGEKKYVEKQFYTYDEPSFVSAKGGGGQSFSAQEVPVIDGTTSGWLKIISYEGEKWINPNGEKKYVEKSFYTYNEPSFVSAKGGGGQSFSAQEMLVIDGITSGWLKIISYEGEKWINPSGEKKYVEKSFYTYNEPSFVSAKGGGGQSFSAQEVPVIDGTTSGWLKINSYEGEKWINPNGEKKYVEKSFYTYNEPSFVSAKGNGGQSFSAQEVLVIDGTTSGWLKIISYEGEKWINPNGGIEMVFESTAYSVENSPPHERITACGIDIGKNPNIKLIAVDPNVIRLGTQVDVEGYGVAIAGDTGGAIKGKIIDVLFPTEREAIKWGRKKVKIRILN